MRIGLLTGGGDCPGLNAVIRAVVRKAIDRERAVAAQCQRDESGEVGKVGLDAELAEFEGGRDRYRPG